MTADCEHEKCERVEDEIGDDNIEKCIACGMIFLYCDLCSWENEHTTYHAEPHCRAIFADYEERLDRARKYSMRGWEI